RRITDNLVHGAAVKDEPDHPLKNLLLSLSPKGGDDSLETVDRLTTGLANLKPLLRKKALRRGVHCPVFRQRQLNRRVLTRADGHYRGSEILALPLCRERKLEAQVRVEEEVIAKEAIARIDAIYHPVEAVQVRLLSDPKSR